MGLQTDAATWAVTALLLGLWAASLRLLPHWRRLGPLGAMTSLFGYVWIGFGVAICLRFLLLSFDSVTYGNQSERLAVIPVASVYAAVCSAAAFWTALVAGYVVGRTRSGAGPYLVLDALCGPAADGARIAFSLVTTAAIVLTYGGLPLPSALVTPVGVVARLWVVPAAISWYDAVEPAGRGDHPRGRTPKWAFLLPGLLLAGLSPYREHVATVFLIPFLAALFQGRRFRLTTVAGAAAAVLVVATLVVGVARKVAWEGLTFGESIAAVCIISDDDSEPGVLTTLLRRGHAFDSLLLTIDRVPFVFPHSEREVLLSSVVRGVLPRFLNPDKEAGSRGFDFSLTVWSENPDVDNASAIAPSMPGDLYEARGLWYVVVGGLLWGVLVGLCDGWIGHLRGGPAVAVLALLALQCSFSTERDFGFAVATMVQTQLVLLGALVLLRPSGRGKPLPFALSPRVAGQHHLPSGASSNDGTGGG